MANALTHTHAFVLAAGLGLRMRPLTLDRPKPLVEVSGQPLIDYALDFLEGAGIKNLVVNASYKADMLQSYLQEKSCPSLKVSCEVEPLETGGGIRHALPLLSTAPFYTLNSDIICISGPEHPLHRLAQSWDGDKMDALLLLHPREKAIGFDGAGDFSLQPDGAVKRRGGDTTAPYIYAGIQLVHPRLFKDCPPTEPFSLNVLYNRGKMEDGTLPRIHGIVHDGQWLHVGDKSGLSEAEAFFSAQRAKAYA